MHREQASAELDHLRPGDGRLQPLTVMERCVPEIDRRVITTERHLQSIAPIEPEDHAFDFCVEAARWGGAGSCIGSRRQADLTEKGDARRKFRRHVQDELPLGEPPGALGEMGG